MAGSLRSAVTCAIHVGISSCKLRRAWRPPSACFYILWLVLVLSSSSNEVTRRAPPPHRRPRCYAARHPDGRHCSWLTTALQWRSRRLARGGTNRGDGRLPECGLLPSPAILHPLHVPTRRWLCALAGVIVTLSDCGSTRAQRGRQATCGRRCSSQASNTWCSSTRTFVRDVSLSLPSMLQLYQPTVANGAGGRARVKLHLWHHLPGIRRIRLDQMVDFLSCTPPTEGGNRVQKRLHLCAVPETSEAIAACASQGRRQQPRWQLHPAR